MAKRAVEKRIAVGTAKINANKKLKQAFDAWLEAQGEFNTARDKVSEAKEAVDGIIRPNLPKIADDLVYEMTGNDEGILVEVVKYDKPKSNRSRITTEELDF